MNTCINIKIKTKAIILDHLQATLSLPSRYHYKAPQSGPGKLLWGNNQIHLLIVEKSI